MTGPGRVSFVAACPCGAMAVWTHTTTDGVRSNVRIDCDCEGVA